MKSWKRSISGIMSVIMLAGTLANSGFTVVAADDDGPLALKEGEEWVADDGDETPVPAEETADDGEDSVSEDEVAEEAVSADEADKETETEDAAQEEAVSEDTVSDDEAEETVDDAENEPEWEWDAEAERDERDRPVSVNRITVKLRVNGQEYELEDSEIEQLELVRPMSCVFPAIYKYKATKVIDGTEYTDEREMGFGEVPTGHQLDDLWVLNTDDVANPYYYPDQDKTYHCPVCDQDVRIDIPWGVQRIEGDDRPSCNHDVSFRLGFQYILLDENGEWSDLFPFYVESPELVIPATGVHGYMRNNDAPWWDWIYDEENNEWHVEAVFWCGECNHDVRIGEGDELKLNTVSADGITTYTAVFKSDKFYNKDTGKLDRSVEYSTEKKITENKFEISGIEDKFYTGKPIKFDNLWITVGDHHLEEGVDFTIKYANNKNVGKASVTVTGKGKYTGSVTVNFNILPVNFNTDNFNVHDLFLIANGKVQKKASVLYYNGAALAKGKYSIEYNDSTAGAYKEPGRYKATIKAKNKNFTGSRTYYIHIMDPGTGEEKLLDASKVKVTIDQNYFKATPWGDINWEVFDGPDSRDKNDNRMAYKVSYKGQDISSAFQECYIDVDSYTGKGVLTVATNPMHWVDLTDKKGKVTRTHFGGSKSVKFTLTRGDISKLKITAPASMPYEGYAISTWELREFYGFKIEDPDWLDDDGEGNKVPHVLNMGDEYEVTLKGNAKAGKMSVKITGKKGYTGKVTKTIQIDKVDIEKLSKASFNELDKEGSLLVGHWWYDEEQDRDFFDMPGETEFSAGGAVIPGLQVGIVRSNEWTDGEGVVHKDFYERWLDPQKDYTVKYSNNQKASAYKDGNYTGAKAKVTITGKGNYSGTLSYEFYIAERNMWGTYVEMQAAEYKKSVTMAPFLPKPKVIDWDTGKVLKQNKDYTVKYYRAYDKEGNELPDDKYIEIKPDTKWDDIFAADASELTLGGHGMICRIEGIEGSGYCGTRDYWYCIVKSCIKANEFTIKDQVLAMDQWSNPDQWMYFIPDDDGSELYKACFRPEAHYYDINWYLNECSDAQYKAWRDKYFSKCPTDCRFAPVMDSLKNWDKTGKASVNFEVLNSWDPENNNNPGCRGGFATVKFQIVTKSVVKD